MHTQTYLQLTEIITCMMTYTARIFRIKNEPTEMSICATGLKEMAEDLQQLGSKTFNPKLWQHFCEEVYHSNRPVDIHVTELQSNAWLQILQKLPCIASSAALLEGNCHDPEMVTHIVTHELTPFLDQCMELLDSGRPEIRGKSFMERIKEWFGK